MNTTNFVQTGGFPVKAERLQEMQTAYSIFNQLGNLAGNLTILSGCVVTGVTVSSGYVVINSEVLPFQGGNLADDVIIIQTESSKEFKNGEVKAVHYERFAVFGTSEDSFPWDNFKRIDPIVSLMTRLELVEKKSAVFQAGGGMVLWNKPAADIPEGWAEVVNWKGRIPVGYDITQTEFNLMGKQGGSKNKTLSIAEIPAHNHDWKFALEGDDSGSGGSNPEFTTNPGNIPAAATNNPIGKTGNNQAFSIMNPYRVVMFIEYIG